MKFKDIYPVILGLLLFYAVAGWAQNEDIYDSSNYNPNVAYGNIVIDDTEITSEVKQAISPFSRLHIKVSSQQGIVSLSGDVNSANEANRLVNRAESVRGVHGIDASGLNIKNAPFSSGVLMKE